MSQVVSARQRLEIDLRHTSAEYPIPPVAPPGAINFKVDVDTAGAVITMSEVGFDGQSASTLSMASNATQVVTSEAITIFVGLRQLKPSPS